MKKITCLFIIFIGIFIALNINVFALTLCQVPAFHGLLNAKESIAIKDEIFITSDSPQITSFGIGTTHVKEGYQLDAWANVHKSQDQSNIVTVKVITSGGDEFVLSFQSSNFYAISKFYANETLPLGLTKIVVVDQAGKSDTVSKNLTNVVEEFPAINYPTAGEPVTDMTPTFKWKPVYDESSSIRYTLHVYKSDHSTVIWQQNDIIENQVRYNVDGKATELLKKGSTYYFAVYAFDTLGNSSYNNVRFFVGNYDVLENELVKIEFSPYAAAPYKYTNKKNNAILWGDQSSGEMENLVEVIENQKSIHIRPTVISVQVYKDSIMYRLDCNQNNVSYALFSMVYILKENELKVHFKDVTEKSNVNLTWFRTPLLLSANGGQSGSTMIIPFYEGFSVDIQKSSEGYFETTSNIGWQFVLPSAMMYHSGFEGILSWKHQDLCSYYRIRKNIFNENEASMGMIFNYKYAPTDFSKVGFIPVFDEKTKMFEAKINLSDDYDKNNTINWQDGAKLIRDGINLTPYKPYLNKWLTLFFSIDGQFVNEEPSLIFSNLYHLTDHDTIYSYILGISKYNNISRFVGDSDDLDPKQATLGGLKSAIKKCKDNFNINLSLGDMYTDYTPAFPDYDPELRVMLADGTYHPGWSFWDNHKETYLVNAFDYMVKKGVNRVNKTLNLYPVEKSYWMDALSLYSRRSYTPNNPSSNAKFLEGIKILINEFNKRNINITSEGLSACFADFGLGWFLCLSPLIPEKLNFTASKEIPLLPYIYHGKTLYGQRTFATVGKPIISSLLDALILGASSGSQIHNGNLKIDEFYLIDLPWRTLNTRFMNDFQENGSYQKVTYDNNSFVEVDFDKDTYKVQVDGKVVAENYTTIYPKNDSTFLIYSRDPKEIIIDLPQSWTSKIKLYKLTETGPVDINAFALSGNTVKFVANVNTPYKLINVRHTATAPVLSAPANKAVISSTHPVLSWQNVENIHTYQVQVSETADFNKAVYDTTITGNSFNPVNLNSGQSYFWRVRSINLLGAGNWAEVFTFSGAPIQRAVCFNSENDKIRINIPDSLASTDFTVEFLLKVDSIPQLTVLKEFSVLDNRLGYSGFQIRMWGDKLPLGMSMVSDPVLYCGNSDIIKSKTWQHVAVVKKGTNTTVLIDGQIKSQCTATYSIKSSRALEIGGLGCNALMDEIRIWSVARGNEDLKKFSRLKLTGNEPRLRNYWSFDNDYDGNVIDESINQFHGVFTGETKYVYVSEFLPVTPKLLSPFDNAKDIRPTTTFIWTKDDNAMDYQIQISGDSLFSRSLLDTTNATNSITIKRFQVNNTFYWRVRTRNLFGSSSWSKSWKFSVIPVPVYAQEYHIVYRTPNYISGQVDIPGESWVWWNWDTYQPDKLTINNWTRDISSIGYPLVGPYDSRNKDIIRWQIRLAKNSGLSGLFVDIFFDEKGYFRPDLIEIFENILTIAQEEDFKVAVFDEAAFGNSFAQNLETMTLRVSNILKTYKDHPAYLKINGQPAYTFDFYNLGGWTYSDLNKFFTNVESNVGDIFWLIGHGSYQDSLLISKIDGVKNNFLSPPIDNTSLDSLGWSNYRNQINKFSNKVKSFNKFPFNHCFVGFDDEKLHRETGRKIDRNNGEFISNQLEISKDEDVPFIILSSFNDWCENSNFEPGWVFDDYKEDPYQYPRIIADFVGKQFVPPVLPPKESVDKLMWGKLYGIDKAGPFLSEFIQDNNKIKINLTDDINNVTNAECFIDGSQWVRVKSNSEGSGMKLILQGDGLTTVITKDGREARAPLNAGVNYHYFDNTALTKGDYNVYVAVEFFDEGTQGFCIDYQSTSNLWQSTPFIYKNNTGKWKSAVFYLEHAAFGNGQNYSADFRVSSPNKDLVVARVSILIPDQGKLMKASDGAFDSLSEKVEFSLPNSSDKDLHGIYIKGKDAAGNWSSDWFSELIKLQECSINVSENISICQGQNYKGWTVAGTYQRKLTSINGCDSTVTTNLTVNPVYALSENKTIKEGQTYNGWNSTGVYKRNLLSKSGCDSIVTTYLTVLAKKNFTENISICQGNTYKDWSTTGIYKRTLTASNGADSIVTTYLTVNPTYNLTENKTICNGQSYNGWTISGTYKRTLQSKSGCDSIVTTNLSIFPVFQPAIINVGDTLKSANTYQNYKWFDDKGVIPNATENNYIITKSGKYHLVITDNNGCTQTSGVLSLIPTNIKTTESLGFKYSIIPNPNNGQFRFRIDSAPKDNFTLKLINPVGQLIESRLISNSTVNHYEEFEVSHLSKGIYLLVISSDWVNATEKIIVQ